MISSSLLSRTLQPIPNRGKQFNAIFLLLRKTSKIKWEKYFHLKVLTLNIQLKTDFKAKENSEKSN